MIKHYRNIYNLLFFFAVSCSVLQAQGPSDIFGKWVTIDDKTGTEKSQVEIYKVGDKAFGKITKFIENPQNETTKRCTACDEDDDRYNQLVLGMEFIRDMDFDGNRWVDGTILDPEEGRIYDCKIWQEDGKLKVRGFIAFFYRTQEWVRSGIE